MQQGWSASVAFRAADAPQDLRQATEVYLFVVTNKPVNVGSAADLQSIYPEGELEYPNDHAKSLLPLFDALAKADRAGLLQPFLRFMALARSEGIDAADKLPAGLPSLDPRLGEAHIVLRSKGHLVRLPVPRVTEDPAPAGRGLT